jgi:hypothetical protein
VWRVDFDSYPFGPARASSQKTMVIFFDLPDGSHLIFRRGQLPQYIPSSGAAPPGAAVHPAFVEACMARIAEDVERQGWRLGKSIVTRSKECGLVWRIDFEIEGSRYGGNLVDRVICWRSPDSEISASQWPLGSALTS